MANIHEYVNNIRKAQFGKDVRESIALGIESMNAQCEQTELTSNDKVSEMNSLKQMLDEAEHTRIVNENERIVNEEERNNRFQALDSEAQIHFDQIQNQQVLLENAITEWNDQKDRGEFHGSFWLYGDGVPDSNVGKINDWYIDRSSQYWSIYHRENTGWVDTGRNLIGSNGSMGGDTVPIGAILPCTTNHMPIGWLLCDGSIISRRDYPDLFAVIGETYGAGDGVTTFALPNEPNPLTYTKNNDTIQFIDRNPVFYMIIKAKQAIPVGGTIQNDLISNSKTDAPSVRAVNEAIINLPYSNENLLINGRFLVWQRGDETTGSGAYCADRWNCAFAGGTGLQPTNVKFKRNLQGGIDFHYLTGSENTIMAIRYAMANSDLLRVRGKTVTVSWESNDQIYKQTLEDFGCVAISNNEVKWHRTNKQIVNDPSLETHGMVISYGFQSAEANRTYNVKWIKLELGTHATLCTVPSYEDELHKCMAYYEIIPYHTSLSIDGIYTTMRITHHMQYEVTKVKNPTVTFYDANNTPNRCTRGITDSSVYHDQSCSLTSYSNEKIVGVKSDSGASAGYIGVKIEASAEIM